MRANAQNKKYLSCLSLLHVAAILLQRTKFLQSSKHNNYGNMQNDTNRQTELLCLYHERKNSKNKRKKCFFSPDCTFAAESRRLIKGKSNQARESYFFPLREDGEI